MFFTRHVRIFYRCFLHIIADVCLVKNGS